MRDLPVALPGFTVANCDNDSGLAWRIWRLLSQPEPQALFDLKRNNGNLCENCSSGTPIDRLSNAPRMLWKLTLQHGSLN